MALRGQTQGAFNGWLFVYRPAKGVSVEAVGQLCVITADHGTRLAWLQRGFAPGQWTLLGLDGHQSEGRVLDAAPVLWMRQ